MKKTLNSTLALALFFCTFASFFSLSAAADETLVKKTLDGRCLASSHPEYWKTKAYIAKPSMQACIASGGKKA